VKTYQKLFAIIHSQTKTKFKKFSDPSYLLDNFFFTNQNLVLALSKNGFERFRKIDSPISKSPALQGDSERFDREQRLKIDLP
jgi:hypothetical protein